MDGANFEEWIPTLRCWVMPEQRRIAEPDELVNQFYIEKWDEVCGNFDSTTPGDWLGWLFRCFKTWQIDWLRKHNSQKAGGLQEIKPLLWDVIKPEELDGFSNFFERVKELESTHRIVLTLHYFTGLTQSEIGNVVGKTAPAVNQWVEEALEELRRIA